MSPGAKHRGLAAVAQCLLPCLLTWAACSRPAPHENETALLRERYENLERQARQLASWTDESCPRDFPPPETGRPFRISIFYGHDLDEGQVHDRANARAMYEVLQRGCFGALTACGFSARPGPGSPALFRLTKTIGDRKVDIDLYTSSPAEGAAREADPDLLRRERDELSRAVKASFYRELVESDVVFYGGHSRLGGGLDFEARSGVGILLDGIFRFRMRPVLAALRQRPTRLRMLGMFSCYSDPYFRRDFQAANPSLALILTTADILAEPAEQASLGALDALLAEKCGPGFERALISASDPDPAMTHLVRGE